MTSPTPRTGLARAGALALAVCAALGPLAACTSDHSLARNTGPVGPYRLVAFDTCADALNQIRAASQQAVGPYGFGYAYSIEDGFGPAVPAPAGAPAAAPGVDSRAAAGSAQSSPTDQAPAHSDTNNQEAGVDEPDLVKTDGNRILIVHNGVLNVIDAASHQITGTLSLVPSNDSLRYAPADLLLSGDHALVLYSGGYARTFGGGPVPMPANGGPAVPIDPPMVGGGGSGTTSSGVSGGATGSGGAPAVQAPDAVPAAPPSVPQTPVLAAGGPRLLLIDLAGTPKLLSTLAVDGTLLDARQTGSVARIVVNSAPRINFPDVPNANQQQRIAANQKVIGQATLDHWLPRIDVATGSKVSHVQVGCDAISRPTVYSGSNLLTVLSLDLAGSALDNPQPITLLADGQTVYSNGDSLYVATDLRWRAQMSPVGVKASDTGTTVYQFDTSKPGRPSYVAGGGVPGYLVNQYAMSARDGYLRVATTSGNSNWESNQAVTSQSGVYILKPDSGALVQVGKVEGLGKGEKIYAVRFLDNTAYVVTFKQTDPLYTVDLTDPTKPRVRGELKITGYSSYLHPIAGDRMIGLGQDVDGNLRTAGTQVSLFDVSSLDSPDRLAVYQLPGSNSQAEFDPHAFLYWPATRLLVIPINGSYAADIRGSSVYSPSGGALVLQVGSGSITPLGTITQPAGYNGYDPIQRTLVIGNTLWTVSADGLLASDLSTLQPMAWIPLV